jgi:uncharacterized protein YjdB
MPSGSSSTRRRAALLALGAALSSLACQDSNMSPDRCFVVVASVTPSAPTLAPADSVHLTATYNHVAAACLPSVPTSALVWRSADPQVATVDSARGLVTAVAVGQTQVSVYAPRGSKVLGAAFVKVTP